MVLLDGTYDGGGDDLNDGFSDNEVDHSEEQGPYDTDPFDRDDEAFEYPQQEDYENDADNFESHQCALDMDYGDGDD